MVRQVCRGAGYFEQALHVAQAAGQPQWYLDILLEDMGAWDEALAYLQALPRQEAAAALQKYGKVGALRGHMCVARVHAHWCVARWDQASDLAYIFDDRQQHVLFD